MNEAELQEAIACHDELLYSTFTTSTRPRLRQYRADYLAQYKRMRPSFQKELVLEIVKLITYLHNVDLEKFRVHLAKLKASAANVLEEMESIVTAGERRAIWQLPAGSAEGVQVDVVNEGSYLKEAGSLRAGIEWFESGEAVIQRLVNLRQQGVAPASDLGAFQNPSPPNNLKKGAKNVP